MLYIDVFCRIFARFEPRSFVPALGSANAGVLVDTDNDSEPLARYLIADDDDPVAWFFLNLFKPLFSHAEVLALSGERLTDVTRRHSAIGYISPIQMELKAA
jgi:hypothetical protein